MTFRTRFAPSPTGFLHPGNIRTAIFCYLAAKAAGGEMILRIEDSDRIRNKEDGAAAIAEDLHYLGLHYRQVPPQSARVQSYQSLLQKLQDANAAYPCFCSPAELDNQRKECIAAGIAPRYSGKCAQRTAKESQTKITKGESAAWRFRMPKKIITTRDIVRGDVRFDGGDIGDFIIRRLNGDFSFIFVNAADDAADGISCVLRGEDHLPNLPRQLALLSSLSLSPPQYGHLPLITGDDGKPLSKRGGAPSIKQLREEGYLPIAMTNYLARIGHKFADDGMMTMAQLADNFALSGLSKAAAKFDMRQLSSRQQTAIQSLTAAEKLRWMRHLVPPDIDESAFAAAIGDNVSVYAEVRQWAAAVIDAPADDDAQRAIQNAGDAFFCAADAALTEGMSWRRFCDAAAAKTGLSGRKLYLPLRAALTGKTSGPQMAAFFGLLSFAEQKRRLKNYY